MTEIPKITAARITPANMAAGRFKALVEVEVSGSWRELFEYYDDELTFVPFYFIGGTVAQAHALFTARDIAYLQS